MNSRQVDVLVIGSGIGGMCAAAYLSHKGYQILVTEALPRIGGQRHRSRQRYHYASKAPHVKK
jgi:phytoene dehydrogenase-like protein